MPVPLEVAISGFGAGILIIARLLMIVALLVIFGPWLVLTSAAWLLEPRPGSWGAWPHILGLTWAALVIGLALYGWFRR